MDCDLLHYMTGIGLKLRLNELYVLYSGYLNLTLTQISSKVNVDMTRQTLVTSYHVYLSQLSCYW